MKKIKRGFYSHNTLLVAQEILGKFLVREIDGEKTVGKIVETEAYVGDNDLACHASKGKTKRTEIMFGKSGHAYIYMIYGMYFCLNIVTGRSGFPAAVLIRALEPILSDKGSEISNKELLGLASGPGKLCRWMKIDKNLSGVDLVKSNELYIKDNGKKIREKEIVKSKRIGVDYAKHCKDYLWRYYIKESPFVSKK